MTNWTDAYVGLPFRMDGRDRAGLDCWGLVRLVYAERLGVDLPSWGGVFQADDKATLGRVARIMRDESRKWQEVSCPQEYDVVMMRYAGLPLHVGLFVPRRDVLHIEIGIDSVREPIATPRKRHSIIGYFRHVSV